jgi:hypothetical protein
MVRAGARILEGVNVTINKVEQMLTPNPTVSNKDSADLAQKIRYLVDKVEAAMLVVSSLDSKIRSQSADLFVKDLSVGSAAVQVDSDGAYRDEVILLADASNTSTVYVGGAAAQLFPLAAGAAVGIRKTALNLIYVRAASGTQTVHIICGGA